MKNPTTGESPLYLLLNEINAAARNGLPFLAITMVAALPEICASLCSNDGRGGKKAYKEWCISHLDWEYFSFITPYILYSMRCGVLHNGRVNEIEHGISRVIFLLHDGNGNIIRNGKANDAYLYSLVEFCEHFTKSVFNWFEAEGGDPVIQEHLPKMMQYRIGGFAPYIVGPNVIA